MKVLYWTGWALTRVIARILGVTVRGEENVPHTGGVIVATNHISYFDPPLVGSTLSRELFFLTKMELFENKLLGSIIARTNALPIRRGVIDRQALDICAETIKNGQALLIFPEGTRSKTDEFLAPKPGIGMIARRAQCPVIPGYIHGSNRLAASLLRLERLRVTFGAPLSVEEIASFPESKEGFKAIADVVMSRIRHIKESAGK